MTGTDALELVLVTTGAVTTAGAVASLVQSWLDLQALVHAGRNGVRHLVVTTRIVRDIYRMVTAIIIAVAGFWCLALPSDMDATALILKHALMFAGWVLMAAVFTDWQARHQLEEMLERHERGDHA